MSLRPGRKDERARETRGQDGAPDADGVAPDAPAVLSQEDIIRMCSRIEHMFAPHAGNPLMERLCEAALQLAGEGRIRD